MNKVRYMIILIFLLILFPTIASANMVWPALYVAEGIRSWYIIVAGLIIECIFILSVLKANVFKSALMSLIMNAVSSLVGIIWIPLIGIVGEFMMIPIDNLFDINTFHSTHWFLSCVLAIFSNVLIEGMILNLIFKYDFKKNFIWLSIANSITVVICFFINGFNY